MTKLNELSILIVDDTRLSNRIIAQKLTSAGITDIRETNSPQEALQMLEKRPADCVLADWLMPEMDGLQLTRKIRKEDSETLHYTYIIVLTAKEGASAMHEAFESGIDDFINKSFIDSELLPRLFAANRISNLQKSLRGENKQLKHNIQRYKSFINVEPVTGLANPTYAENHIRTCMDHCEARGGCLNILMLKVVNYDEIRNYSLKITSQVMANLARRFKQLVRPMDFIARISNDEFIWVCYQSDTTEINMNGLKRIPDGVALKAYQTSAGFINVDLASAATRVNFDAFERIDYKMQFSGLLKHLRNRLVKAKLTKRLDVSEWPNNEFSQTQTF